MRTNEKNNGGAQVTCQGCGFTFVTTGHVDDDANTVKAHIWLEHTGEHHD